MKNNIILPEKLIKDFKAKRYDYQILVFSGACGVGKTTIVNELFDRENAFKINAETDNVIDIPRNVRRIIIDNTQALTDAKTQQELILFIKSNLNCKFVFLTRSEFPNWLVSFRLSGDAGVITDDKFYFSQDETKTLLSEFELHDSEIAKIHDQSQGNALFLSILSNHLRHSNQLENTDFEQVLDDFFICIDEFIFSKFSTSTREIILNTALFDDFQIDFIKQICGKKDISVNITEIIQKTTYLQQLKNDEYKMQPIFKQFSKWKMAKEYDDEKIKKIYEKAGLYYELHDDINTALHYYLMSDDMNNIVKLLVENARKHPPAYEYIEHEKYYLQLSDDDIIKHPELMAGMSILKCLRSQNEDAIYWLNEIDEHLISLKKNKKEYADVKRTKNYLQITLAQSGTDRLVENFKDVISLYTKKELSVSSVSITSLLPSALNGSRDFSWWSKRDAQIYKTYKKLWEVVLGKNGIGMFDCAICESKFEKDEEYMTHLVKAMSNLEKIQQHGTHEVEFYLMGLMSRIQIFQGENETARETLNAVSQRFSSLNERRFDANIKAMLCKIDLLENNYDEVNRWLTQDAQCDDDDIWVTYHMQYIIKAEAYMKQRKYLEAITLLSKLLISSKNSHRVIDQIYVETLISICYYRQDNFNYKEHINTALNLCSSYNYVYPIAQFGASILPVLSGVRVDTEKLIFSKIISQARAMAKKYPNYLLEEEQTIGVLTPTEKAVLRLICQNNSNIEMCNILNVKMPTIQRHTNNIFRKLKVTTTKEAKIIADNYNLIINDV